MDRRFDQLFECTQELFDIRDLGVERDQAEALETLASALNHDMRNPISAVLLNLAVVERLLQAGAPRERIVERLASIRNAAQVSDRLLTTLVELVRIRSGKIPMNQSEHAVESLMLPVIEQLRPVAHGRLLKFIEEVPPKSCVAHCDREHMVRALMLVTELAMQSAAEGGKVILRAMPAFGEICFEVRAPGPWFGKGHGIARLGVRLAQVVAEAHGGRAWMMKGVDGEETSLFLAIPEARL